MLGLDELLVKLGHRSDWLLGDAFDGEVMRLDGVGSWRSVKVELPIGVLVEMRVQVVLLVRLVSGEELKGVRALELLLFEVAEI